MLIDHTDIQCLKVGMRDKFGRRDRYSIKGKIAFNGNYIELWSIQVQHYSFAFLCFNSKFSLLFYFCKNYESIK